MGPFSGPARSRLKLKKGRNVCLWLSLPVRYTSHMMCMWVKLVIIFGGTLLLERSGSWKPAKKKRRKRLRYSLCSELSDCAQSFLSFDSQIVTELINWTFLPVHCFNMIATRCSQVLNRREQTVTKISELTIGYVFYSLPYKSSLHVSGTWILDSNP